jgi:hypothetical protein
VDKLGSIFLSSNMMLGGSDLMLKPIRRVQSVP